MEEPMKQKLEIKNILSFTVLNLIQIKNLDLSEYFLIGYPNLKDFGLFILQYTKKNDKNVHFGDFFFHWLEIEQIEKNLIEISKFELIVETKTK